MHGLWCWISQHKRCFVNIWVKGEDVRLLVASTSTLSLSSFLLFIGKLWIAHILSEDQCIDHLVECLLVVATCNPLELYW